MFIQKKINIEITVVLFCAIMAGIISFRYYQSRLELSDFKVYYGASRKMLGLSLDPSIFGSNILNQSDKNPYHFYYGLPSGYYKYTPFFLSFIYMFSILPWSIVLLIYPFINLFCLCIFIIKLKSLFLNNFPVDNSKRRIFEWSFILAFVIQTHNFYREILLGNINIFLMLCLLFFVEFNLQKKKVISSLFLSFIVLVKPHFAIVVLLLLFYKEYKTIFYFFVFSILLLFSIVPLNGFHNSAMLMKGWIIAMQQHNNSAGYISNPINLQFILWKFCSILGIHFNRNLFINLIIGVVPFFSYFYILITRLRLKMPELTTDTKNKSSLFVLFVFFFSAIIPFVLLVDTNQLIYVLPFSIYLIYNYLVVCKINKLNHLFFCFIVSYLSVIFTQQIPNDVLPVRQYIGAAYLSFFILTYVQGSLRTRKDHVYLAH